MRFAKERGKERGERGMGKEERFVRLVQETGKRAQQPQDVVCRIGLVSIVTRD